MLIKYSKHLVIITFLGWNLLLANLYSFNGMASGTGIITDNLDFNLRYIPRLEANLTQTVDIEFSGNIYTDCISDDTGKIQMTQGIQLYRGWIRYNSAQFEARLGLQKINFGSAKILRSLMWFDQLDPKDPFQFTDGVYALRLQYYFQNNANIWLWSLYGNNKPQANETKENSPEFGGRIQYPLGNSEFALSAHHRLIQYNNKSENRIAVDGFLDVGIGLWFESAVLYIDYDSNNHDYQSFLTLGIDYTFPVGNGITATAEHLSLSIGNQPFGGSCTRENTMAISFSYPAGMMDNFSYFCYVKSPILLDAESLSHYISWQRTYDKWLLQIAGVWSSESKKEQKLQVMIIYNH